MTTYYESQGSLADILKIIAGTPFFGTELLPEHIQGCRPIPLQSQRVPLVFFLPYQLPFIEQHLRTMIPHPNLVIFHQKTKLDTIEHWHRALIEKGYMDVQWAYLLPGGHLVSTSGIAINEFYRARVENPLKRFACKLNLMRDSGRTLICWAQAK